MSELLIFNFLISTFYFALLSLSFLIFYFPVTVFFFLKVAECIMHRRILPLRFVAPAGLAPDASHCDLTDPRQPADVGNKFGSTVVP